MGLKLNPILGSFDIVVDTAPDVSYTRADGSKTDIQASSDDAESALNGC